MPPEGSSTSFFPTSRRSACDRCRKQKLRCPPREDPAQPCLRCVRAGLNCVTGYTKPLGRSSGDRVGTAAHNDAEHSSVSNDEVPNGQLDYMNMAPVHSRDSPSRTTATTTAFESPKAWMMQDVIQDDQMLANGWLQTPTSDNAFNSFFGSYTHESFTTDSQSNARPSSAENSNNTTLSELDRFLSMATPSELGSGRQMSHVHAHAHPSSKQPRRGSSDNSQSILSGAECDVRLSQLSLDLSRQLQNCLTKSQERKAAGKRQNPQSHFDLTRRDSEDQPVSNPFGDALRSTSEFLAIILSYDGGDDGTTTSAVLSNDKPRHNGDSPRVSISFACTLTLLSSYLRIVAIFDNLLHRLYEVQLHSEPSSLGSLVDLQVLPDLRLAGFSVQQGSLQAKILIQAVQHQFELIEKILGLPVELRVSDRREIYRTGLLQNKWARNLLYAVLNGERGGNGADGADTSGFDHTRAVDSLESLKESINKVRQISES